MSWGHKGDIFAWSVCQAVASVPPTARLWPLYTPLPGCGLCTPLAPSGLRLETHGTAANEGGPPFSYYYIGGERTNLYQFDSESRCRDWGRIWAESLIRDAGQVMQQCRAGQAMQGGLHRGCSQQAANQPGVHRLQESPPRPRHYSFAK